MKMAQLVKVVKVVKLVKSGEEKTFVGYVCYRIKLEEVEVFQRTRSYTLNQNTISTAERFLYITGIFFLEVMSKM